MAAPALGRGLLTTTVLQRAPPTTVEAGAGRGGSRRASRAPSRAGSGWGRHAPAPSGGRQSLVLVCCASSHGHGAGRLGSRWAGSTGHRAIFRRAHASLFLAFGLGSRFRTARPWDVPDRPGRFLHRRHQHRRRWRRRCNRHLVLCGPRAQSPVGPTVAMSVRARRSILKRS